jgi:hypothetical protein
VRGEKWRTQEAYKKFYRVGSTVSMVGVTITTSRAFGQKVPTYQAGQDLWEQKVLATALDES